MSMQDILRTLMESSQQGGADKPAAGKDAMSELLGGLMGGGAPKDMPAAKQGGGMFDHMAEIAGRPIPREDPLNIVREEHARINKNDPMAVNEIRETMKVKKSDDVLSRLGEMR